MQILHPNDKRLIFEAEFHEAQNSTRESDYSRGDPPQPAFWEITAVAWQVNNEPPVDITDFVVQYASKRLTEWEEELLD